ARIIVEECGILRRLLEAPLRNALQELLRVLADRLPERGVQAREELAGLAVPAEPEVSGQFLEPRELRRNARVDLEGKGGAGAGFHGHTSSMRRERIIEVLVAPLLEALEGTQDLLAERGDVAPRARELDAPALRGEHGLPHGVAQFSEQARDGGLRHAELLGGARDAAQAQARLEGDQLGKQAVTEVAAKPRSCHGKTP